METIIRILENDDLRSVQSLSTLFWEGGDYLGNVASTWIKDGGFWGLFCGKELIGCAKMTKLPYKVIWLEGLRIHPKYQNHGLGKHLSSIVLENALKLVSKREADHIEFSTYYLNQESIHIATDAGFCPIDEHVFLTNCPVVQSGQIFPRKISEIVYDYFPVTMPFGWKFLHPGRQSLTWLNKRLHAYNVEGGCFYAGGEQPVVCLLSPAGDWIKKALPIMQSILGKNQEIHLMLNKTHLAEAEELLSLGFHWWDADKPDRVLVYRYKG